MSTTIVDMPKVTQMLDAGWVVQIHKGGMGSYEVRAQHPNPSRAEATRKSLIDAMKKNTDFLREMGATAPQLVGEMHYDDEGVLMTDDFTPEQALTRMAYKTFGEIL